MAKAQADENVLKKFDNLKRNIETLNQINLTIYERALSWAKLFKNNIQKYESLIKESKAILKRFISENNLNISID